MACSIDVPDRTNEELDLMVHDTILKLGGAYSSPLNYAGFPKSLCSLINEVICHGITNFRTLRIGDLVKFYVNPFVAGVHGDNFATIIVGDNDDAKDDKVGVQD